MIISVCQISGAVGGSRNSSYTAPGERRHDLSSLVTILMLSRERAKLLLLTVSGLMGIIYNFSASFHRHHLQGRLAVLRCEVREPVSPGNWRSWWSQQHCLYANIQHGQREREREFHLSFPSAVAGGCVRPETCNMGTTSPPSPPSPHRYTATGEPEIQ